MKKVFEAQEPVNQWLAVGNPLFVGVFSGMVGGLGQRRSLPGALKLDLQESGAVEIKGERCGQWQGLGGGEPAAWSKKPKLAQEFKARCFGWASFAEC